jgi:hypothetical protein
VKPWSSKIVRSLTFLSMLIATGTFIFCYDGSAATGVIPISISGEGKISVDVEDHPIAEVFRLLSERQIMGIAGYPPKGMVTTARFIDLSLEQALFKLMRGYNYALVKQNISDIWTVTVLGVATRSTYGGPVTSEQALKQSHGGSGETVGRPTNSDAAQPPTLSRARSRSPASRTPVNPAIPPLSPPPETN